MNPNAQVYDALIEILVRMRHSFRDVALAIDPELSPMGLRLLRVILDSGVTTGSTICHRLDADPATISRQIKQLIDLGYVTSEADPQDRRSRSVALTPQGEHTAERARELMRSTMLGQLESWDRDEVESLAGLLAKLVRES